MGGKGVCVSTSKILLAEAMRLRDGVVWVDCRVCGCWGSGSDAMWRCGWSSFFLRTDSGPCGLKWVCNFAGELLLYSVFNCIDACKMVIGFMLAEIWENEIVGPGIELGIGRFLVLDKIGSVFIPDDFVCLRRVFLRRSFLPFDRKRVAVIELMETKCHISIPHGAVAILTILLVVVVALIIDDRLVAFEQEKLFLLSGS